MRMTKRLLTTASIAFLLALIPGAIATLRAQAPSGPREGIMVHGHWTIDVREPDGRLVNHREFENALVATGGGQLQGILSRHLSTGPWAITLASGLPPCEVTGVAVACRIVEPGFETNVSSSFSNLTLSPTGLTLSGTATAARAGRIDAVSTTLAACAATVLPSACADPAAGNQGPEFSRTTLSPSQNVAAGQIIQVTVTFTFS